MRILLMGDASNCHASLAVGLRRLGHEVTVASDGSRWMDTSRDIDISRGPGKLSGAALWLKLNTSLAPKLKGFDVVQLANPVFVPLKPRRVERLFDKLRRDNGGVFLTALGTDTAYIDLCTDPSRPLRYSEWRTPGGKPTEYARLSERIDRAWHTPPLQPLCRKVYEKVDGVVSVLYEYHLAMERVVGPDRVAYGGIPIDLNAVTPLGRELGRGKINMLLGRHRARLHEKGTDVLERVAREVVGARPDRFQLEIVENLPYAEYVDKVRRADIVFDQLYSYTPATNALLTMAAGQVAVSGAEPEYYDFIGEEHLHPIINAVPGQERECVEQILALADNPAGLERLGREGREFVARHNDCEVVARRFVDFWLSRI